MKNAITLLDKRYIDAAIFIFHPPPPAGKHIFVDQSRYICFTFSLSMWMPLEL